MKLPSTIDPRRRRAGGAEGARPWSDADDVDGEHDYAFLAIGDDVDGDEEWVEADEEVGRPDEPAPAPSGRRRRFGSILSNLLPLDERAGDGPDGDDGFDDPDIVELAGTPIDPVADRAAALLADRAVRSTRPDVVVLLGDDDPGADEPWDAEDDDQLPVDPRIAARRDGVAQARRSRRRRRLVTVAIVAAVIAVLGALTRSAALDVNEVAVTGADRSDAASIAAAAGIPPGTPLLGLDLDAALARVRAQPWILDATIDRTWSGTISISVVEREPVATINAGAGGWLLVDRDRRVVADSPQPPPLPIIDGVGVASVGDQLAPEAQAAIDVAAALTPGVRTRVAVVDGSDPGAVELTLTPSGTVRFGPATQLDERVRSLQAMFSQVDLLCLATIDLRVPDAPVLTRVPACA
jgi:cell division protein FtsQ